ncbi:MAG: PQQ-binding-like beta-propeller repeat protein [Planctomycetota bacterium]
MRPLRSPWLPPALLLLAVLAALSVWHGGAQLNVAQRFMLIGGIAVFSGILLSAWLLVLSPLSWRRRLLVAGGCGALVIVLGALVRIDALDGDTFPRFAFVWQPTADVRPDESAIELGARDPVRPHAPSPGFLGRDRTGVIPGVTLEGDWQAAPPRVRWRRPVGAAWSGFAVVADTAITQEQYGEEEVVSAYRLADGSLRWRHTYPARYASTMGGIGPRATPSIAGDAVLSMGATGILHCLALADGTARWRVDVLADTGGTAPQWGMSASPLVCDGAVIVAAGGPGASLAAYALIDGSRLWGGGGGPIAYASPMLVELDGVRQVVLFGASGVCGHDPADGSVLWQIPWPGRWPTVAQPVVVGADRLVISSAYGTGAICYRVFAGTDGWRSEVLWRNRRLQAKFSNLVHHQGFLYGFADGVLVCHDADNGERRWRGERYGHGQVLLVGDDLLLTGEKEGLIALVSASPEGFVERARMEVFDAAMENPPALAPPYLLLRTIDRAACLEMPLADAAVAGSDVH